MDTNNGIRNNNETKEKATWIQIMVSETTMKPKRKQHGYK